MKGGEEMKKKKEGVRMMEKLMKSVLDSDRAPVVICSLDNMIRYMNPSAVLKYGCDLTGKSIMDCHGGKSGELLLKVVRWFSESRGNNMIYSYRNDEENKDVYMVALRDENGELIGYYEKHEFRDTEKASLYDFSGSLI